MKSMFNVVELKFNAAEHKFNDVEHTFSDAKLSLHVQRRFIDARRNLLTGGSMAYTRPDGVKIIPLACLKD